jgi:hypothetical protein
MVVKLGVTLKEEWNEDVQEHGAEGMFGPKRDEVTRSWRRLLNEELHYLCSSPNIIRVIQ